MHFLLRVLVLKVWKPLLWMQRQETHGTFLACTRGRGLFVLTFGSSVPRSIRGGATDPTFLSIEGVSPFRLRELNPTAFLSRRGGVGLRPGSPSLGCFRFSQEPPLGTSVKIFEYKLISESSQRRAPTCPLPCPKNLQRGRDQPPRKSGKTGLAPRGSLPSDAFPSHFHNLAES